MIDWSWKIKTETILALVIAALLLLCVLSITVPLLVIEPPVQVEVEASDWQARYYEAVKSEERALAEVEIWQACCIKRHQLHSETLRKLGVDKPPPPGIER